MRVTKPTGCLGPDDVEYTRLRGLVLEAVRRIGIRQTSKGLGISPECLLRLTSRLPVRAGSVALLRERIPRLEAAAAPSAVGT